MATKQTPEPSRTATGPRTQKAVRTVRKVAAKARTEPEIEHADRAMAQVDKIEREAAFAPKESTSFNTSTAVGGHSATSPGLASAHKKRAKLTQAEQSAEFERVAREHGAEGSEAEFNGVLRKLAKPKTS